MHDTAGGGGLVLSLPESIVIQPQPEGRELIIPRFAGIIEQMCFEIGHHTIEVPVVISSQTCMVCNAETQEGGGRGSSRDRSAMHGLHGNTILLQNTTVQPPETAGKAINP